MIKKIPIELIGLLCTVSLFAQPQVKFSGYIQTQYQYGERDAKLKVGIANENPEKSFSRIGIRRGRIKLTAEEGLFSGVFQIDLTEKGLGLKDAYLNVKDPWINTIQLRAGVFDRPYGNEISYSSSRRESPERSTVFQTLFPNERDLGGMLILQPAKTSPLNILKLEAGLFGGNGIQVETFSPKDFIGHLTITETIGHKASFGVGASYYNGRVYQGTKNVYTMQGKGFVVNDNEVNRGKYAKREYIGFDAQFSMIRSIVGTTQVRAECLFGQQPSTAGSSNSPNAAALPIVDTYIRNFQGYYVILIQDLGNTPFSAVFKYDSYNPNTKVSGDEIGLNGTSKTDLAFSTFGFGALWKVSNSFRLQAFYEINKNENSTNVSGYDKDLKDNIFTMRLQYRF